jgi:hypothetical protein
MATRQTTKASLLKTTSFALQSVDATKFYDATLQGNNLTAAAHTSVSKINSVFTGDTLTARGNANTLTGGAGNDSLVSSGAGNLLVASAGADTLVSGANGATFQVANAAQLIASSIAGGSGSDTLRIASAAKLTDTNFSRIKGTEVLSLTGASSVELNATALAAGINNVVAGTGNSTLTQGSSYSGGLTLSGGAGKDLFILATGAQVAADSLSGGAGLDTLVVATNATLNDASFSKVSGVEVLSLSGTSAVTLGANAGSAGFSTIIAGSITQTAADTLSLRMVGSALNDSFTVATAAQLTADTIVAGTGTDTLAVSQAATIADAAFANTTGVEVLSLGGNSTVTLDKNATKAGITSVVASSGSLDLSVTAGNTSNISVTGSTAGDNFRYEDLKTLSRNTINGGSGNDTLSIGGNAAINDSLFGNVRSVEALSLAGGNVVTLAKAASDAGLSTIYGGTGTLGSSFTQTSLSSGHQTIFGGAGADIFVLGSDTLLAYDSLVGGAGIDTLKFLSETTLASGSMNHLNGIEVLQLSGKSSLVSANVPTGLNTIYGGNGDSSYLITAPGKLNIVAGSGNDRFQLSEAGLLSDTLKAVTLAGGRGIDSLIVDGSTGVNDAFTNVSGVEVLSLNGAANVTLGAASKTTGISQVFTGGADTLGTTVVQTEDAAQSLLITTGKGNDLISIANGILLSKDSIDGGDGVNTLRVETASRLTDSSFKNIQGTQVLSLIDDKNSIELGTLAGGNAGIATIVGAGSDNTINAANYKNDVLTFNVEASDGGNVLTGSSTEANRFMVAEGALSTTTIKGGSSKDGDTLSLNLADGFADSDLAKIRGVEVLELSGAGTAVLGSNAIAAGFLTVFGGEGDMVISRTAGALDIEANANATSNLYSYTSAVVAGADTIVGTGKGNDTLAFEVASTISDATFANKSGIQVVSLTGNSSVELGSIAEGLFGDNTDATTLIGGDGSTTITQTADAPFDFELGDGTNNYLNISSELLVNDTIVGSDKNDTLAVSGAEVTDESFANITGISVLQLTGDSLGNASVTLDSGAAAAAFATVAGSTGNMAFNLTSLPDGYVLDGRAAQSNLFSFTEETLKGSPATLNSASAILAANTLIGGGGIDTIFLASDDTVDAGALANTSGIEVLSLSGSSEISLDSVAGAHGLVSILGGDGDMSFTLDGGAYYLGSAEATSNLFTVSETTLLGNNTIVGSGGDDTVAIAGDGVISDQYFGHLSGVTVLSLGGSNEVVLGDLASLSGVSNIYGGDGDVVADLMTGSYAIDVSDATGSLLVKAADSGVMAQSTIAGNGSLSTLAFDEGGVADGGFDNVKKVGTVQLTGSSYIELGDSAALVGNDTLTVSVIGGAGDTEFYQTAGSFVLDGSNGTSNLFVVDNASTLAAYDTILGTGNDFADTLAVANDDTLIGDTVFANISGVSVLSLTGDSRVTLGSAAAKTGIVEVIAGDGDSVFNLVTGAPEILLDGSASSSLLVGIANASLASATTLYGGDGTDTLSFGGGSVIEDEAFTNVQGFEILTVTGGSAVTLGGFAAGAYLDTVYGGTGINTITQNGDDANALYLNGGSGQLRVELDSNYYLINDTILGGTGGGNTLSVGGSGTIEDNFFANDERLQTLLLAGDNAVFLGADAAAAGITKVIVEDGDNSFTVGADGPAGVTLDARAGKGDNSFAFDSADQLVTARIYGADGIDTLSIASEASIGDTLFARADGIEVLSLTGATDVTLGIYADTMELSTVIGGSGGTTFTQDAFSSNSYYLDGRADSENGNLFVMASAAQAADDTLLGGEGIDTLRIATADSLDDADLGSAFANISNVEVLDLTGSSSVVLGAYADQSSIMTVSGGLGDNVFTQTSASEAAYYLSGGDATSNLFAVDNALQASIDTFEGGLGKDTMQIGEDAIDDSVFTNHTSIEVLQLTGSSEVLLGQAADNAGIATVIGGTGDTTLTQSNANASSIYMDGSDAKSNLIILNDAIQLASDTLLGGTGLDTLQIGEDVIVDTAFTNHSSLEVVQLTGSSEINLGEKADYVGISTVIGGAGATSFVQLEKNYTALYLDGSDSSTNSFTVNDRYPLSNDTLLGGGGIDTLQIATADSIFDTDLAHVNSVEVIRLTGSSDVTLGEKADYAGISTVIGGAGSSTITHADKNYSALYLDGSNGGSNLFVINDESQLALDTIIGGNGNDTLQMATGVRFDNTALANVSLTEVLQLSGSSDVTLASAAGTAGISSIYGGSGATSLDASAMTRSLLIDASAGSGSSLLLAGSGADNVTGGSGADTLQGWSTTGNSSSDSLFGGAGADLFVLGSAAANAYGSGGSKALLSDFTGGTDALQLHDYGSGASSYRVDANAGSGYTHQLFDTSSGSDVLLANINYSGSNASGDLLGVKAIFAA